MSRYIGTRASFEAGFAPIPGMPPPPTRTYYAVCWTERNGRTAEFHYANRDEAARVARQFRGGWRKDTRVVEKRA